MASDLQGDHGLVSRGSQKRKQRGPPERSRERVEDYIADLTEAYPSFPVNQTTVSIPGKEYADLWECEHGDGGFVDASIQVHDRDEERGVLHVAENAHTDLPGVRVGLDDSLEHEMQTALREDFGLSCAIKFPKRATITGVRNAADPDCETLYHVVIVFEGTHIAGTVGDNVVWKHSASSVPVLAR
jgi:sorbitol-specific phosphotransferase system component IIA